ncbi:MAG TPA: aromatic-ring-hydroxylating dioxygenase subunit beta [Nevskiaceae bacterium]|nr:aromatic-ring-hydroxylating dioxygenase subunit beta [Nevskiaceae bacterium]
MSSMLPENLLTRLRVEEFLFAECDLLDRWQLDDWLKLYTDDCRYEVGPTGKADSDELSSATSLFLIADDRFRLEQRLVRMSKTTCHAEYPRSRTRHLYSNVRVAGREGQVLDVRANFATYRTNRGITNTYVGHLLYTLVEQSGEGPATEQFRVRKKRVTLDLDNLVPQGKVTILL